MCSLFYVGGTGALRQRLQYGRFQIRQKWRYEGRREEPYCAMHSVLLGSGVHMIIRSMKQHISTGLYLG